MLPAGYMIRRQLRERGLGTAAIARLMRQVAQAVSEDPELELDALQERLLSRRDEHEPPVAREILSMVLEGFRAMVALQMDEDEVDLMNLDAVLDKVHKPLFERLHKDKKPIRKPAELKAFFVQHGVSAEDFDNTFSSFAVVTKTNRAKRAPRMYGITGVPALVVNGKYLATARLAGGNKQMLKVVDYLIDQERNAKLDEASTAAAQ